MKKDPEFDYVPVGLHLSKLSRQYIGVITKKLSDLDIERYFYVLVVIDSLEGQVSQQLLCEVLGKDKATMVRIIDYLSKYGCIERMKNEKDRREYHLAVTSKGKKYVPLIKKAIEEANTAVFEGMEQADKCTFFHFLKQMSCNLSSFPADKIDLSFKKIPD